jgi:hypothetical protein
MEEKEGWDVKELSEMRNERVRGKRQTKRQIARSLPSPLSYARSQELQDAAVRSERLPFSV